MTKPVPETNTRSANWIDRLPEPVRSRLKEVMTKRSFAAGEYLYRQGEMGTMQFQILSGTVRLRVLAENGKETTYVIYGPGDCIGYISAIDGGPRPQDVIALGDVTSYCLPQTAFEQLRDQYPIINRVLCEHVTQRLRELFDFYDSGNFFSLRRRLATQMLFLLRFGNKSGGGVDPGELMLTQEMLATSVCATRQAVAKLLKEWTNKQIIEHQYGSIRIIDIVRFNSIADGTDVEYDN